MTVWLVILGIAASTFLLRASFIVFADPARFPKRFRQALDSCFATERDTAHTIAGVALLFQQTNDLNRARTALGWHRSRKVHDDHDVHAASAHARERAGRYQGDARKCCDPRDSGDARRSSTPEVQEEQRDDEQQQSRQEEGHVRTPRGDEGRALREAAQARTS